MKILFMGEKKTAMYGYYTEIFNAIVKNNHVTTTITPDIRDQENKYDLIIVGFQWTDCGLSDPVQIITNHSKPIICFLNKEYAALDKKLIWIKTLRPLFCITVHHDYLEYQKLTNVPFFRVGFAVNPQYFVYGEYKTNYSYDLGFSGVVRQEQTNDWRGKILKHLESCDHGIKYIFEAHKRDDFAAYAKRIPTAKCWLSTTGPADIVGTRYYEIMASGTTLLVCNKHEDPNVYGDVFVDGINCVMFSSTQELIEKVKFYSSNNDLRMEIVKRAQNDCIKNHTWDCRASQIWDLIHSYVTFNPTSKFPDGFQPSLL